MKKIIGLACLLLGTALESQAHRRLAWSYNSPTLAPGTVDMELWNTYSFGNDHRYFSQYYHRLEVEMGLTDRLQTSFYFNNKHKTVGPSDSAEFVAMGGAYKKSSKFTFSNAWKYNFMNPSTDVIGLAGYLEYYLGPDFVEAEAKIMIDKALPKSWYVWNSTLEHEWEFEPKLNGGEVEREMEQYSKLINEFGYMYHPKPNLGFGLEGIHRTKIVEGEVPYSALYGGPTVFYSKNNFFFTLNVAPRLSVLVGEETNKDVLGLEQAMFRAFIGIGL